MYERSRCVEKHRATNLLTYDLWIDAVLALKSDDVASDGPVKGFLSVRLKPLNSTDLAIPKPDFGLRVLVPGDIPVVECVSPYYERRTTSINKA
jgi:hypothetical protein